MKNVIWKFALPLDENEVDMPTGAKILDVQIQKGELQLWALCDKEAVSKQKRKFVVFGTGSELPENYGVYISTFQTHGGLFVFHVFEINI